MRKARKYLTAGGTFAAAAITAHFMQSSGGETTNAGFVSAPVLSVFAATAEEPVKPTQRLNDVVIVASAVDPAPVRQPTILGEAAIAPLPPKDTMMPTPLPQVGLSLADRMAKTPVDPSPAAAIINAPRRNEFGLTCGPILSASMKEAAMVSLILTAPCRGNEEVVVFHSDLSFSGRLNPLGTYTVDVPAFEAEADFRLVFEDGTEAFAMVDVPMVDMTDRVAIVSDGQSGLQIHALEFGANYNEKGHVWSGAARDAATAILEGGGYMIRLGDESTATPIIAEVYTFPDFAKQRDGVVRLSVEAEVTSYNCGKEVEGRTIELGRDGEVTQVAMTVAIPDCTAIGEYLVLKNLLRDLKIALN
jgi:hypothetical protein